PLDERTAPAAGPAVRSSYAGAPPRRAVCHRSAPAKTSSGPVRSRLWNPSNRTNTTGRGADMGPSSATRSMSATTTSPRFLPRAAPGVPWQTRPVTPSPFLHPFAKPAATRFLTIVSGEGAAVFDAEGNRYVDGLASLWYCNVGHARVEIADAVR